ncbi:MAG: hypothetical protein H6608_03575 [Flavobacteriales bacterium]|nr:hypothetical protein [Bacteroidota bacterium]MCB9240186.1 hypothetical protein [Flavobacteriales bacterium]
MKKKIQFLLLLLATITWMNAALAQVEDTTLYRTHKISEVQSWVYINKFENSNDTCLFETKTINEKGWITHIKQDYHCHGWDVIAEVNYQYNDKGDPTMITTYKNDNVESIVRLWYNDDHQVIREETKYMEPYVLLLVTNQYFGDPSSPDSLIAIQVRNGDSTIFKTTYQYANGKEVRADVVDVTNSKPFSSMVSKYDSRNRLKRSEYLMFQIYDNDEITLLEYNEKDQVSMSKSELNNTSARFWYDKRGLMIKTMYYNRFEELEREVWHRFKYRE